MFGQIGRGEFRLHEAKKDTMKFGQDLGNLTTVATSNKERKFDIALPDAEKAMHGGGSNSSCCVRFPLHVDRSGTWNGGLLDRATITQSYWASMISSVSTPQSPVQTKHVMLFIDGRNLARRYADLKKQGNTPKEGVVEIDDSFVWKPIGFNYPWSIRGGRPAWSILRAYYYTYFTATETLIAEHSRTIKSLQVFRELVAPTLTPIVFKKNNSDRDAKGDDVALSVEALHHSYHRNADIVHILTGDGSYIPLIEELKHLGILVFVSAFSSGLNQKIEASADVFFNLDHEFFDIPDPKLKIMYA